MQQILKTQHKQEKKLENSLFNIIDIRLHWPSGDNGFSSRDHSCPALEVGLAVRIDIYIRAAVERSPLRLILEQTHSLDVLYVHVQLAVSLLIYVD